MKYLKIQNNGELDIRLIALMGGTTKADDKYKIGHFGTGLKYTLAWLFRNDVKFKIFVGKKEVDIHLESEKIGEEVFEIICINGHRTSITTKMGNDWDPWMIIRELYSNALDEGGAKYETSEKTIGKNNKTTFYIEFVPDIMAVYNNWDSYFIVGKEAFYESEKVRIYPQSGNLRIYKQGILIHEKKQSNSLFNYDILDAEINELREYKGYLDYDLIHVIYGITDKKVIQYFLEHTKDEHFESKLDYNYWGNSFGSAWEEALKGVKIIHQKAKENLEARGIEVDTASNVVVPKELYKGLTKKFEGVGALRVSKAVNDFYEIYNQRLDDRVNKAKGLLEDANYFIEPELTFIYGIFGNKTILAKVDVDEKKIYMSEKHLDRDLFSICATLVEENEHYKTEFEDHTRAFQQHFIDLYVNQLVEKSSVELIDEAKN